ncbi:Hypothetical protein SMAX5B_005105 [Scophthalmus maximus]|uniref:Uncharacterized protein n=1 Tax=Scophthalmus maximus TaxID=52904 RepID=A0A2U9BWD6_SCOMX|nr:Hypothetical protein SMAX5B_005105 [Scophthalmus maximus]
MEFTVVLGVCAPATFSIMQLNRGRYANEVIMHSLTEPVNALLRICSHTCFPNTTQVVLTLTSCVDARRHEGAALDSFSLTSKCMQQDAEKLKPVMHSIGERCGARRLLNCLVDVTTLPPSWPTQARLWQRHTQKPSGRKRFPRTKLLGPAANDSTWREKIVIDIRCLNTVQCLDMRRSAEDRASRVAAVTVDVVAERTQLVLADSGAVCQLVSRLSNGFRQHLNEDLNTQDSESNIIPATHLPVRGL